LSASTQLEGAAANYVFTATLSNASQGVTTIHTDQGDITIANGATTGSQTITSELHAPDYLEASSLPANITGSARGNFQSLLVGTASAPPHTLFPYTTLFRSLSASTQLEGAAANYVFTATLSNASQGVTTIHTDQGDITIANGATT